MIFPINKDLRGKVGEHPITAEFMLKLGWALSHSLINKNNPQPIIIGKDPRISGYMLEAAMEAGLVAAGATVYLTGPMPTPAIAYLTKALRCDLGIVITGSHNPYYDNGVKLFARDGYAVKSDFLAIVNQQLTEPLQVVTSPKLGKAFRQRDASGRYIEFCKNTLLATTDFRGIKIVIDCANGATFKIAPALFSEMGATVIALNVNPNGSNINDHSGAVACAGLQHQVIAEKADLGIAFDGDGDRVILVDAAGNLLDGDDIIYILAHYYRQISPAGVVLTEMSNSALQENFAAAGISYLQTEVGVKNILQLMHQQQWYLGAEPCGHVMNFKWNSCADGIMVALHIVEIMLSQQKQLAELVSDLHKYPQVQENITLDSLQQDLNLPYVQLQLQAILDGYASNKRFCVRYSNTEPLVRIMVESRDEQNAQQTVAAIKQFLTQ